MGISPLFFHQRYFFNNYVVFYYYMIIVKYKKIGKDEECEKDFL